MDEQRVSVTRILRRVWIPIRTKVRVLMVQAQGSPRVFVSHSHDDNEFCRMVVQGLRQAGYTVWYDEHNLGSGQLRQAIEEELRSSQHFIVILSPPAVSSVWVNMEIDAALAQLRKKHLKTFLPVVAHACDIPLTLEGFKRIEGLHGGAIDVTTAIGRVVQAIQGVRAIPPARPPANPAPQHPARPQPSYGQGQRAPAVGRLAPPMYPNQPSTLSARNASPPPIMPGSNSRLAPMYPQTVARPQPSAVPAIVAVSLGCLSVGVAFMLTLLSLPIPIAGIILGLIGLRSPNYRVLAIIGIVLCVCGLLLAVGLFAIEVIALSGGVTALRAR